LARTGRAAPEKADAVATEAASRTPLNIANLFCTLQKSRTERGKSDGFGEKMHLLKTRGGGVMTVTGKKRGEKKNKKEREKNQPSV
jgi:hypothetical protein